MRATQLCALLQHTARAPAFEDRNQLLQLMNDVRAGGMIDVFQEQCVRDCVSWYPIRACLITNRANVFLRFAHVQFVHALQLPRIGHIEVSLLLLTCGCETQPGFAPAQIANYVIPLRILKWRQDGNLVDLKRSAGGSLVARADQSEAVQARSTRQLPRPLHFNAG